MIRYRCKGCMGEHCYAHVRDGRPAPTICPLFGYECGWEAFQGGDRP